MVALDGEKMSKSKGNLVFVSRLRAAGVDPMAIRLALLAHHYRSDWEWTGADLDRAADRLSRWRAAVRLASGPPAAPLLADVRRHLAEDLDAPAALTVVDRWAEHATAGDGADGRAPGQVRDIVDALLGVAL
jgi:L-cysteine:1D-myo-inositol 2-amino-2-deoxy-alpha-D-glucopyranoside ligase